jgi:hypothetical protein
MPLHHDDSSIISCGSSATVNADFIGNVEQVLESGLLTNVATAAAFCRTRRPEGGLVLWGQEG